MTKQYSSDVLVMVMCPRCQTAYEVLLKDDEKQRTAAFVCHSTTNPAMKRDGGYLWCGQTVAYEVSRRHTNVAAVPEWTQQRVHRFRRVKPVPAAADDTPARGVGASDSKTQAPKGPDHG